MAALMKTGHSSTFESELFNVSHKPLNKTEKCHRVCSLLSAQTDLLFLWEEYNSCIRVVRISPTATSKEGISCTGSGSSTSRANVGLYHNSNLETERTVQELICTNPPLYAIKEIQFNASEDQIALIGQNGIAVMTLPRRWGSSGLYEDGKQKILCKTLLVDERYFASHKQHVVLKALWHPGSPSHSHLCVITSDNTLRIYNSLQPAKPYQTLVLNKISAYSSALGESFVSMDFGSPENQSWPLYLLTGMGDVFLIQHKFSSALPALIGPLHMLPAAEDNYGSDACDLICLNTEPAVIVIVTAVGVLYHCVLLENAEKSSLNIQNPATLYVYDSVQLEMILTVPNSDNPYDFTTHIQLIKEPMCPHRYHCAHLTGVHSISLPWVKNLSIAAEQQDGNLDPGETVCDHMMCTQLQTGSDPSPIRGLTFITEGVSPAMLCLLQDYTCLSFNLREQLCSPGLFSESRDSSSTQQSQRSFNEHIAEILKRSTNNPLIVTGKNQNLSTEQSLELLMRTTQIFRDQSVTKLLTAKDELDKKLCLLTTLRDRQSADLAALDRQRDSLTDTARQLAERYEDIYENHGQIVSRLEAVMTRVQSSMAGQTDAERALHSDLLTKTGQLGHLTQSLKQVKEKLAYQQEKRMERKLPMRLNEAQLKTVNSVLADESDQIESMIHQIQSMLTTTS